MLYVFFFSFIALLITLWMKTTHLGIELALIEPSKLRTPHEVIEKLETIIWLFNLRDSKGGEYYKKVFDGLYQSVIVRRPKEAGGDGIHEDDKTSLLSGNLSIFHQEALQQESEVQVKMVEYMIENYIEAMKK